MTTIGHMIQAAWLLAHSPLILPVIGLMLVGAWVTLCETYFAVRRLRVWIHRQAVHVYYNSSPGAHPLSRRIR